MSAGRQYVVGGETNMSMKFMPMKEFLTRASPSLGTGTGRSVLYCSTSGPPVFSMMTPFMRVGTEIEAIMNRGSKKNWKL